MAHDNESTAPPKQLRWADPQNLSETAHRLQRQGYSREQIAIAMEISIDAVDRLLAGGSFGYVGGNRI